MIDETAEEIADMQTHSSSVVAVKAASALRELLEREYPTVDEYKRTLERNSNALRRSNPSHASLQNTQQEIVSAVSSADVGTVEEVKEVTANEIDRVIETVETGKRRAAERATDLIVGEETLLTHDFSTTVLGALEFAIEKGAEFTVYVTEARPRFIGRKMARRLAALDGVDTNLIVDSAAGLYLEECDRVLVGMDCIVDEKLYNRVGTYPIATTAADQGVPMTALGTEAKLVDGGFSFKNEYRNASEVMLEPADGFAVHNPAYDATPVSLLDTVVTDEAITEY